METSEQPDFLVGAVFGISLAAAPFVLWAVSVIVLSLDVVLP